GPGVSSRPGPRTRQSGDSRFTFPNSHISKFPDFQIPRFPHHQMTERLYYLDPYLREFDARVVERTTHEGKSALILDRTAFSPTSGGQPYDVGTLSNVKVTDVVDTEDGRVLHVVDRLPDGEAVKGVIDWARRFDHMQQHTGQHVLSAAFARVLGARTESFH